MNNKTMKKLLTIFALLIISVVANGQETKTLEFVSNYVTPDTTGKICKERGHVSPGIGTSTLVWCPPYQIDYIDSTVMVYPVCNTTSYVCSRCGEMVSERGKESRVVIWRRIKKLNEEAAVSVQEVIDTTALTATIPAGSRNLWKISSTQKDDKNITFQMLLDYEKECVKDTVKAEKFENEYIVWHKGYGEALTEKQLIDKGYKYAYRWYKGMDSKRGFLFDYYFIKEPSLKGFIEYMKTK